MADRSDSGIVIGESPMKKIKINIDKKYVKICTYASATVITTAVILFILAYSGGFWEKLWHLFTAIIKPIIIGGIIDYLLKPVVAKAEKGLWERGFGKYSRAGAVALSIILTLAVISGIIGILAFTLYRTVSNLDIGDISALSEYLQHNFAAFTEELEGYLSMLGLSAASISRIISTIVSSVSNVASSLLFGVIFSVYFMLDGNAISKYWMRVVSILFENKSLEQFKQFLADADRVFSGYIRGQFIDAFIIGVLTTLSMIIIGVPNGVVVGVLTGCGNLIPYVGPVVGYLTLALVCIPSAAWGKLIAGAIALAVLLFVDGNIINPKLLSTNVMVHPLLVVAALIGGGAIGGIVGMLIAVPVAALIKVQLDRYLDFREQGRMGKIYKNAYGENNEDIVE